MHDVPLVQVSLGIVDVVGWLKKSPRVATSLVLSWLHREHHKAHSHRTVCGTLASTTHATTLIHVAFFVCCRRARTPDCRAGQEEPRRGHPGGAEPAATEGRGVAQGEAGHEAPLLQGLPAELPQVPGPPQLLLQAD